MAPMMCQARPLLWGLLCVLLWTLLQGLSPVLAKEPFVKDMRMDIPFPPKIDRPIKGVPLGHLRPLGYQKRPSSRISATSSMPTPHSFNIKYIRPRKAGVLKESAKHLPVLGQWDSDEYLEKQFGQLNVSVTKRKEMTEKKTTTMTMKKFLMDYKSEDWFLHMTLPLEMSHDLHIPAPLKCGSYSNRLQEAELWMSAGPTSSLLHNHEDHVIHCNLFGRNDFIVIEGDHRKEFSYQEKYTNAGAGYSSIDMDFINMYQFPKISQVPWTYSSLYQGDCIFIPAGLLHHVRSHARSISYSILFAPSQIFDSSDCRKVEKDEEPRLDQVNFVWTYRNGSRVLYDDPITSATIEHALELLIRDGEVLNYERFEHFYDEALANAPNRPSATRAWNLLTSTVGQQQMSRSRLRTVSKTTLSKVAKTFQDAKLGISTEKDEL